MTWGRRTGGRKAGTLNKATQAGLMSAGYSKRISAPFTLENLQAVEKVPKPGSSGARFLEAILALDPLYWVSDVELGAHADKIRVAIIFEPNHGKP